MNGYEETPRMTPHAIQRCHEMGIRAKIAKHIVRFANTIYPGPERHGENYVALCNDHPEFAVAYGSDEEGHRVIYTVLYNGIRFTRPEHQKTEEESA